VSTLVMVPMRCLIAKYKTLRENAKRLGNFCMRVSLLLSQFSMENTWSFK